MFKIMLMPDAERLCEAVANCRGDVMMFLPDGTPCSLKRDEKARQMLKMLQNRQARTSALKLSLTDGEDFPVLFQYMLEAAKAA